jgi:hypothetical protein
MATATAECCMVSRLFSRLEIQSEGFVENAVAEMWPWQTVPTDATDPDQIDESTFEPIRKEANSGVHFGPPRRYYLGFWKGFVHRLMQRSADSFMFPISCGGLK